MLSDLNPRLIETYQQVRDNPYRLRSYLRDYDARHTKRFYYRERKTERRGPAARAAQFIYFNRTCWNALYRVNRAGEFNVPIGTKTNVVLSSKDIITQSDALNGAKIFAADFDETLSQAKRGDFIFADPPYTVKHNLNGFVKYNEKLFGWSDQIRLRDALRRADARGVTFVMTNADHESVAALYSDCWQYPLSRRSIISGESHGRSATTELIISNVELNISEVGAGASR